MDFKQIVMERYATKSFDSKKIPESRLNELLELIRYAPSSFNIQPWKIIVVRDQTTKDKLTPVSWNQPQISSCSHLLVLCANTNIQENIHLLEKTMIAKGATKESIQGYVELMLNFEKHMSPEQKLNWAQKQVYIALSNALNGAKSLGFDSCPMEGFDPKKCDAILGLDQSEYTAILLCPIGYRSPNDKYAQEKKVRWKKETIVEFR